MSTQEITAIFVSEFRPKDCGDFAIGTFRHFDEATESAGQHFKGVGNWEEGELKPHQTYRLYGSEKNDKKYGKQLQIVTFVQTRPFGRIGVTKYLEQAPGIGAARAAQIWNLFGSDSIRICRQNPELLCEKIKGLSRDAAQAIADKLTEMKALEGVSVELIDFLSSRYIPKSVVKEAIKRYGNRASDLFKRNPYLLLYFRGVGFLKADSLYCNLGLPPAKVKRQVYCLAHEMNGLDDTWIPDVSAKQVLQKKISADSVKLDRAVSVGVRAKRLATKRNCPKCGSSGRAMIPDLFTGDTLIDGPCPMCGGAGGSRWIAIQQRAANEHIVAERVAALLRSDAAWPDVGRIKASDHQRAGLAASFRGALGCFIGGPGTGKSFTVAALTAALIDSFGIGNIGLASPTNKAAVRLTEGLRANDIDLQASSIHRMLGVEKVEDGSWTFKHSRRNPLPYRVLLLDEMSMLSTDLGACVFDAILPGTLVLLIGDTGQLPPIQHGAVLRDLLAAGVPTGELTEPQRNAGDLVFACHDIRKGIRFRESDEIDLATTPPHNFKFIAARRPEDQVEELLKLLDWAKDDLGIDPVWDCQVMSPVNRNSKVSRDELNKLLQERFNPGDQSAFRAKDKIICDDNGFYDSTADGEPVFVAKGELGQVVTVGKKELSVRFDGTNRTVLIPLGRERKSSVPADGGTTESSCPVSLAYSCTVHRMQGSETKLAIPMIDESPGARWLGCRELFFTVISRGKMLTRPIGNRSTADQMCKKVSLGKRKTFLAELVKEYAKGSLLCQPSPTQPVPPPVSNSSISDPLPAGGSPTDFSRPQNGREARTSSADMTAATCSP